mmetsp:Transcript_4775/g.6671  ORF Transcript_4775/g.6671 Transcript_4775/m.6671 type:complete len:89 (-) Transcript_4775:237-503(-)
MSPELLAQTRPVRQDPLINLRAQTQTIDSSVRWHDSSLKYQSLNHARPGQAHDHVPLRQLEEDPLPLEDRTPRNSPGSRRSSRWVWHQ